VVDVSPEVLHPSFHTVQHAAVRTVSHGTYERRRHEPNEQDETGGERERRPRPAGDIWDIGADPFGEEPKREQVRNDMKDDG
jgi:hypothetical protein